MKPVKKALVNTELKQKFSFIYKTDKPEPVVLEHPEFSGTNMSLMFDLIYRKNGEEVRMGWDSCAERTSPTEISINLKHWVEIDEIELILYVVKTSS